MASPDRDAALSGLLIDLLVTAHGDLARAAGAAVRLRLASLFLRGLPARGIATTSLNEGAVTALQGEARQEAVDDMLSEGEAHAVLEALAARGHHPVILKGRLLALELWPHPYDRPAGDLDLLVERDAFQDCLDALAAAGYRPKERPLRESEGEVGLECPAGKRVPVDLHWALFPDIGNGIDTNATLARAQPAILAGFPVRRLESADRLLFLFVHAAKHGARRLKWLLDLYAAALRAEPEVWRAAADHAIAGRATRPFYLAAKLVADLPGVSADAARLNEMEPPLPVRRALSRAVSRDNAVREVPVSRWGQYALETLIEERWTARLRRLGRGTAKGLGLR